MAIDDVLSYHESTIQQWEEEVQTYAEQLDSYEHFDAVDDDEETSALQDTIQEQFWDYLPDAHGQAYDSFQQLLSLETKVSNSLNHGHEYDELPDDTAKKEQLQGNIETLKQLYRDVKDEQETAYDQTAELFGPVIQTPETTGDTARDSHQDGRGSIPVGSGPLKTKQRAVNANSVDSYVEKARNMLSKPYAKEAVAVAGVVGAAGLGEYLIRRRNDG